MGTTRFPLLMGMTGLALLCGACKRSVEKEEASGAVTGELCGPRRIRTHAEPEDSIDPRERCRLVDLAFERLRTATPESGLVPGDTAAVASALVVPLSQAAPDGVPLKSAWHVALSLDGRPYDAEVIIDRGTGEGTAHRVHKPF